MSTAQVVALVASLSMSGLLLAAALDTDVRALIYLLRQSSLLLRTVLAMNVVMPLFALALMLAFDLDHAVEVSLLAMALSPVPPILPTKELKAGGTHRYTMGLVFLSALSSIVFVPASAALLNRIFHQPVDVTAGGVARIVVTWMLVPLLAGTVIHGLAPAIAHRMARYVAIASNAALILAVIPVLLRIWPHMLALVGHFSIVAIAAFVLFGLFVGHLMGGPDPRERTVLALSTATRHPAVALAILHVDPDRQATTAAVLLVLIIGVLVSAPYVRWRSRRYAGGAEGRHA